MLLKKYPNKFEDITSAIFNVVICDEVVEDIKFLQKKLIHANQK